MSPPWSRTDDRPGRDVIGRQIGVKQELTSSALGSRAYTQVALGFNSGTRLGVYDITAPIGEGGMGQVYRATDTTLGRQAAIKILPDAFAADPDRLVRESSAVGH